MGEAAGSGRKLRERGCGQEPPLWNHRKEAGEGAGIGLICKNSFGVLGHRAAPGCLVLALGGEGRDQWS